MKIPNERKTVEYGVIGTVPGAKKETYIQKVDGSAETGTESRLEAAAAFAAFRNERSATASARKVAGRVVRRVTTVAYELDQ